MSAESETKTKRKGWISISWQTIRIALIVYLGVLLVLMLLENTLIFRPTTASQYWEPAPNDTFQDVYLTTKAGPKIHAWWCPVENAQGALLYCHGNAGNLSHRGSAVLALQEQLNVSVLLIDYPGYGKSEGSASEAACYDAGEAAFQWLTKNKRIAGDNILLYGVSLGGGIVTYLAEKHPHRALVLVKTFTSMPDVGQRLYPWLPVRWVMRTKFENLKRIQNCDRPVFISHGTKDDLVPFHHAESLFAAAKGPKQFHKDEDGDHNSPFRMAFFEELREFLDRTAPIHAAAK